MSRKEMSNERIGDRDAGHSRRKLIVRDDGGSKMIGSNRSKDLVNAKNVKIFYSAWEIHRLIVLVV